MSVTTPPEAVEAETSRAEKLLAFGLVVFLLIGGFWVMERLGSVPGRPDYQAISAAVGVPAVEPAYRQASADYERAAAATDEALRAMDQARSDYEFRREEYRVALERGLDDPALAAAHEEARVAYETARLRYELADAARAALQQRLADAQSAYDEATGRLTKALEAAENRYQLIVFGLRFGYALPLFAASVWLWLVVRRRAGRNLLLATAFMSFAGVQAVGLVGQYGWYLLRDVGPIALSVSGSAVCVAGLVALRRWVQSPRRVHTARLRRGQCPYCGFPLGAGTAFCAGCGRKLVEPCPKCGKDNVPRSLFCRHCGESLEAEAGQAGGGRRPRRRVGAPAPRGGQGGKP